MNVFRINRAAFLQHKPLLALVKRNVVDAFAMLLGRGVNVEQPVNHLAANERLADDFLNVLHLDFVVENFVRQNRDQRPHLAKALAAAFVQPQIMRLIFRLEFRGDVDACRCDLIFEGLR